MTITSLAFVPLPGNALLIFCPRERRINGNYGKPIQDSLKGCHPAKHSEVEDGTNQIKGIINQARQDCSWLSAQSRRTETTRPGAEYGTVRKLSSSESNNQLNRCNGSTRPRQSRNPSWIRSASAGRRLAEESRRKCSFWKAWSAWELRTRLAINNTVLHVHVAFLQGKERDVRHEWL